MIALKKYYRVLALPLFEDNYSYIIQGTAKSSLVLVDPANPPVILNYLQNNFPQHIVSHVLYTHKHWDHAGGSQQLRSQLQKINPSVQVVIGLHDKQFVKGANTFIDPNQEIIIGKSIVRTIHVPCHTRGHTIYSFLPLHEDQKEEQAINTSQTTLQGKKVHKFDSHSCTFTGDTLFVAGIGRFFEGGAKQMSVNIENMIKFIDESSDIFCGHEYALSNLKWATQVQKQNQKMREYYNQLQEQYKQKGSVCSIPSSLKRQKEINLFVRAVTTGTSLHQKIHKNPVELLQTLREMKNNNMTSY